MKNRILGSERNTAGDRPIGREVLAFDAMRRLWVSGSTEYPFPALADRPRRDSIRVFEDRDGDGGADKVTVLADRLSIPVGRDWELISPS
jgi:hypothetical protein